MVLVIVLKSVQIEGGPHQGPVLMAMVFAAYVSHSSEFMGKTFQAAQLTHDRFLTIDHSCKISF